MAAILVSAVLLAGVSDRGYDLADLADLAARVLTVAVQVDVLAGRGLGRFGRGRRGCASRGSGGPIEVLAAALLLGQLLSCILFQIQRGIARDLGGRFGRSYGRRLGRL